MSASSRYQPSTVATAKECLLCGIPHKRHTMAVNNLRSWFARGEDAGALLPVLQAYMGHASIADTDYYLRLTAESCPHIGYDGSDWPHHDGLKWPRPLAVIAAGMVVSA